MSINVTVSGNPVNIKRGKMVTVDPDHAKKEYDKRRRMRLEQVRQQSKEIAEDVRNKVRKEKKKQQSDIEKQGAHKLKQWQNRKLLELQQQYCECLKDIGLGHTQAVIENTQDEITETHKKEMKEKAKERGGKAAQKLQINKNEDNLKKAIPVQHKKFIRDVEDTRAALVSKLQKKPKKKKVSANINISHVSESDSEFENDKLETIDVSSAKSSSSTTYENSKYSVSPARSTFVSETSDSSRSNVMKSVKDMPKKKEKDQRRSRSSSPKCRRSALKSITEVTSQEKFENFPLDTRISDRIKNRHLQTQENFINASNERQTITENKADCQCETEKKDQTSTLNLDQNRFVLRSRKQSDDKSYEMDKIPAKPTVSLRNIQQTKPSQIELNPVQYYDHLNRFSKEYLCDNACVQKIQEDDIEICPSTGSEKEFFEQIYKRDRDAQIRGQKALEKEQIHKNYKELMQQLPVLQRQERIASINTNNPTFHMSDERLRQYELKKQNRMEQAYEKLFPDTPMITIPPKDHQIETEPFKVIDLRNRDPSLNLAAWDVDNPKMLTVTKDCGVMTVGSEVSNDKNDKLKALLEKLKMQKEMLLREVDKLPTNSKLDNLIDELDLLNKNKGDLTEKNSYSTSVSRVCKCPKTASCQGSHSLKPQKKSTQKQYKCKMLSTSNSSTSPSPRKKYKHRRRMLILQNMSTQTTPKANSDSNLPKETTSTNDVCPKPTQKRSKSPKRKTNKDKITRSTSPVRPKDIVLQSTHEITDKTVGESKRSKSPLKEHKSDSVSKRSKSPVKERIGDKKGDVSSKQITQKTKKDSIVLQQHRPCDCKDIPNDLCEILIKIKDDDATPEIMVKSPTKSKKIVTVKTDIQKTNVQKFNQSDKSKHKYSIRGDQPSRTSWREQLSRNDLATTSTSTSYYSPPDFLKSREYSQTQAESTWNQTKSHLSHLLKNKNQQSNFTTTPKDLDPRLLTYIKKLLTMSRGSIDDLGVSTVSEISSPGSSIVDTDKNNPLHQLKNVIKFFNLSANDLKRCLNYSDDDLSLQRNTTSSSGYDASKSKNLTDPSQLDSSEPSQNLIACKVQDAHVNFNQDVLTNSNKDVQENSNQDVQANSDPNFPQTVTKYDEVVEICHKRITDLTAMIEKVRLEKRQMISPNNSDKENSTTYLNLPTHMGDSETNKKTHEKSFESSSSEQSELTRKLLEIDYSLVAKLQKMTPEEIKAHHERLVDSSNSSKDNSLDKELVQRYKTLKKFDDIPNSDGKQMTESTNNKTEKLPPSLDNIPFVPLLLDIPRLPKLPSSLYCEPIKQSENSQHRKPPPAKGLNAAKKFNEEIKTTPHELSTIMEVDSQLSTRLRQSTSPEIIKKRKSPTTTFEGIKPLVVLPDNQQGFWSSKAEENLHKKISDESMPDIVLITDKTNDSTEVTNVETNELNSKNERKTKNDASKRTDMRKQVNLYNLSKMLAEQSTDSSTDKSELENVEIMLKNMGMGWAVATLRKTQEALARASSSSSSLEISVKSHEVKISDNSSTSDVTLHDFLTQKVLNASTSTSKSNLSPFLRELEDISTIQGSGLSSENKKQRTSTPVQTTKSSEKSKNETHNVILTSESDLSSVKLHSDANFLTIPNDSTSSDGSRMLNR